MDRRGQLCENHLGWPSFETWQQEEGVRLPPPADEEGDINGDREVREPETGEFQERGDIY